MAGVSQIADGAHNDSHSLASNDCKQVFDKIDQWQKDLIDLTRRNRALYLTEKKAERQVEITAPGLQELVDQLVGRGASFDFPMPVYEQLTLPTSESESTNEPEGSVRVGDLETNLPVVELQRRLSRLRRDQLTSQEEQGIHTLFLAIAFLKWDEKSSVNEGNEEYLAPMIFVPVGLDRKSVDDPYFMKLSEEDIVVNPALLFKLKTEFGISLPELPEEPDGGAVALFLEKVEAATKDLGWQVVRSVRLGKFTYEKFVMYNDLADHKQDGCHQPIVRALAKATLLNSEDDIHLPDDLDEVVNPSNLFPLLDADSSQMEVLLRFRSGQNLVIQGPPGTGKSQTIANMMAQGLRDGKKILFVSEKMAALEVVNRRLAASGLSFACLEVHSHKSDKLKVVQELAKTLNLSQNEKIAPDMDEQYQKLVRLRDHLNNYVKELHKIRGGQKLSVFQVHGKIARLMDTPAIAFQLPVDSVVEMTFDRLDGFSRALSVIEHIGDVFDDLERQPWLGVEFRTKNESGLPLDPSLLIDDLMLTLNSLIPELLSLQAEVSATTTRIGIGQPASIVEIDRFLKAIGFLSRPQVVASPWTKLSAKELDNLVSRTEELGEMHRQLTEKRTELSKAFRLDLLQLPVSQLLTRFESQYRTRFRFLRSSYRHDMGTLLQHSSDPDHKIGYSNALKSLTIATEIVATQNKIDSPDYAATKSVLGRFYQGEETMWDSIVGGLRWLSQVLSAFGLSDFPIQLGELLQHSDELLSFSEGAQARLKPLMSKVADRIHKLEAAMKSYSIDGVGFIHAQLQRLESWLDEKKNPEDLRNWLSYQKAKENCQKLGLTPFLAAAEEKQIPSKDLEDVFMRRIWKTWLSEAYRDSPILADFMATSHERVIQDFQELDENLKNLTVKIVRQNITKSQPKAVGAGAVAESQMGIILREAQKKRRVMPLRKLFATTPQLIQDLKPCMLMSPLSVASYLGTSPYHFDWVIFDEASQIPPADAIGSILRGSHLIVAGDNRQLPPTTFFQAGFDFDDESDEGLEEPLESVLDECLALPGFKKVLLKWHYRSKREELIDFSNRNFYDGQLVTFPSPDSSDAPAAIEFHYVKDGVYDRGGSRTNVKEARAVCDLIEDHFRQHGGGLSLGVITLGIQQEEAIWDELERRKTTNPTLSALAESNEVEPFFIKSLEKVQGDERDCIIISLGYGKDANGVLSLNFGPINKAGGERRLNVAITRAKEKVVFVSSILPQDMDLTRLSTRSRGVSVLANYLEYAYQGGKVPAQSAAGGEPESDFEYDVRDQLVARGLHVDAQVGCSGFRIDFAIRNPQHNDRYILGIECDGAAYHSHRSARDRDRLRQAVLERLGWRIYRVWSTEWVKNPEVIVDSIAAKVEELEALGPSAAGVLGPDLEPLQEDKIVQPAEASQGDIEEQPLPSQNPTEGLQYGFKPYVEYHVQGKRTNDVQYYVQAIVQEETPIHVDALIRRIGETYGLTRIGLRNRRIILSHIRQAAANKRFVIRGDFCWIGDSAAPRVLPSGKPPRPIQEIALEELMEAARTIVEKERGIPRESLVREVGRVFGYKRTGERVDLKVQQAMEQLYKEGVFSTYGNQVILARRAP